MFYIQQTHDHDCGFTSLKILLANLNHDNSYLFLVSPFLENKNVSFLELIKEAKKYNVNLIASKVEDKYSLNKNEKFPFIMSVNISNNKHALYVYKMNNKYVYYIDPASGKKKMKIDDFISIWDGYLLRVEDFTPTKCEKKVEIVISEKEKILSSILFLLAGVSCILGVYFLNKDSSYYLPLIFLMLMIIFELALKKYTFSMMKNLDAKLVNAYFDIKKKDYLLMEKYYEEYKKYAVTNDIRLLAASITCALIIIILLLNDKMNVIYVGVNMLLALLNYYVLMPRLKSKEEVINNKEAKLKRIINVDDANALLEEMREDSYDYASKFEMNRYLFIVMQLLVSFLMMMYFKIFNVTYLICYTFLQVYLYQNLTGILSYQDDKKALNNSLIKLLSIFENNSH